MRSNNPVFARQADFAPQRSTYAPSYQGSGFDPYAAPPQSDRMTMDDVITRTGLTLGIVLLAGAAAWLLVPGVLAMPVSIASALAALVCAFMVVGRRGVRPGAVVAYAILEGLFIGIFSKLMETLFPGIVVQAVIATFVVAGLTLLAYRHFDLRRRVNKIRRGVFIATGAMAIVFLGNLVLALFGVDTGLRSVGPDAGGLAVIVTLIAAVLATLNLLVDFGAVEEGIRNGAPAEQSWVAAFGLTVSMVWLYTELLRILSFFRQN